MPHTFKRFETLLAAALLAAAYAPPADAQDSSDNCFLPNFVIDEITNENNPDVGLLIDNVITACNATGKTLLPNGPYRRLIPENSLGNARRDYALLQIPGNILQKTGDYQIKAAGGGQAPTLVQQVGVISDVPLKVNIAVDSANRLTFTDMTEASSGFGNQLIDAGPGIGGLDCVIIQKKGIPFTADVHCEINGWYKDGGAIKYGFKDISASDGVVNATYLLWAVGPSGAGSLTGINNICTAFNPPGETPLRRLADDTSNPPAFEEGDYIDPTGTNCTAQELANLDPSLYCVGDAWIREEKTVGVIGDVLRVFGDGEQPMNFTACDANAGYCDPTEPTPATAGASGNACNPNTGGSGVPKVSLSGTLEGNTGQWVKIGGQWVYVNY